MALSLVIGATTQTSFIRHQSMTLKLNTLDVALIGPSTIPAVGDAVAMTNPTWAGTVSSVEITDTVEKGTSKHVHIAATNEDAAAASAAPWGLSDAPNNSTTYGYQNLSTKVTLDREGSTDTTGSCTIFQSGLTAGMTFQLTSANHGYSATDFTVQDVTTRWPKPSAPTYQIDFGAPIVTMSVWLNSGQSGTITTTKITDGSVTTPKLAAGSVSADKMAALLVLASTLTTAESGARIVLDQDGFRVYDASDSLLVNMPSDGSEVFINAQMQASSIEILASIIRGTGNSMAIGSVMSLAASQADPQAAPTLAQTWDKISLPVTAEDEDATHYDRAGLEYDAAGGSGGATKVFYTMARTPGGYVKLVELKASDRTLNRASSELISYVGSLNTFSVCRLGTKLFVIGYASDTQWRIWQFTRSTLALDTGAYFPSGGWPYTYPNHPKICSDGTNLFVVDKDTGTNTIKWNKYDSTFTKVGSTIDTTYNPGANYTVGDCFAGNADFGAARIIVSSMNAGQVDTFTTTGSRQVNEQFPTFASACGGLTYGDALGDGARFWSMNDLNGSVASVVIKHSTWTWTTVSPIYWVAYSWYDSAGTTHESLVGPRASITMGRRKIMVVTGAAVPVGGADDPDNRRIYMAPNATAPATTALKLQTTVSTTSANVSTYASGGAAPSTSNTFPSGSAAELKSSGGTWSLKGDGTLVLGAVAWKYVPAYTALFINSTTASTIGVTLSSALTGVPAGAVAAQVRLRCSSTVADATNDLRVWSGLSSTQLAGNAFNGSVASFVNAETVMCPLDANAKLYYSVVRGAGTVTYSIDVMGYWVAT